jgi:thioredoxin 1
MKATSKKPILVAAAVLLAAGLALTYNHRSSQSGCCCPLFLPMSAFAADTPKAAPTNAPVKTDLPRLVDLGADKCIPCKMMAPILKELKQEYDGRMEVQFIDVWKTPDAGKAYHINLIPTQIFFDAVGKELFRHEGFFSKADILAKWKQLGIDLKTKPAAGKAPVPKSPAPKA